MNVDKKVNGYRILKVNLTGIDVMSIKNNTKNLRYNLTDTKNEKYIRDSLKRPLPGRVKMLKFGKRGR